MNKILISGSKIITKGSISKPNPDIPLSEWKKYQLAFSDPSAEYVLNIQPKGDRTINYSTTAPKTFAHLGIGGKLTLNIKNINTFCINIISNALLSKNLQTTNTRFPTERDLYLNNIDFLYSKEMEVNGNNLDFILDVEHEEYFDRNEITFYKRDLLPLEKLTLNCNQARIKISNQDIKELIVNNKNNHCFNLILKNLYKLEYLDISNVLRLDLRKFMYSTFKQADYYEQGYDEYGNFDEEISSLNSGPINYFDIDCVNPDCIIKLNPDTCFYYILPELNRPIKSIPMIGENKTGKHWCVIYLSALVNTKNKKSIKIKWRTLQQKLLEKINDVMIDNLQNNKAQIKKYFKNLKMEIEEKW